MSQQPNFIRIALVATALFSAALHVSASCGNDRSDCEESCRSDMQAESGQYRGKGLSGGAAAAVIGLMGAASYSCLNQCQSDFNECKDAENERQEQARQAAQARRKANEELQRQQQRAQQEKQRAEQNQQLVQQQQRAQQEQLRIEQAQQQRVQQEQQRLSDEKAKIEEKAALWFSEGIEHYKRKEYADAIDFFATALKLMPDHAQGWYYAALSLMAVKKTKEAEEHAARYLQLEPDSPYAAKLRRALPGASARMDAMAWESATLADTFGSYEVYLKSHPKGKYAAQAESKSRVLRLEAANEPAGSNQIRDQNGCRFNKLYTKPNQIVTWSGACLNGQGSGPGVLVWLAQGKEISRAEGEFKNGVRQGPGKHWWADGSRFEGEYRDGVPHGLGKTWWADGGRFEGEFKDGVRHGQGKIWWQGGNRFEGEFRGGVRHGPGTYWWTSGHRFEGEYRDDVRQGQGKYWWADGSRFEGEYSRDLPNGRGKLLLGPSGESFEGEFKNGCATIRGRELWPNTTKEKCGF